jgi:hypothetical protein
MLLLLVVELIHVVVLLVFVDQEGCLALDVIKDAVDVKERCLVVRSRLDQIFGELLSCAGVGSVTHIAFPETEDFPDQVVFEEVHRCQHIEHRLLLHPVRK